MARLGKWGEWKAKQRKKQTRPQPIDVQIKIRTLRFTKGEVKPETRAPDVDRVP